MIIVLPAATPPYYNIVMRGLRSAPAARGAARRAGDLRCPARAWPQSQTRYTRRAACASDTAASEASTSGICTTTSAMHPHRELQIPSGKLLIRPLEPADVQAASIVLARAFAGSAEGVRLDEILRELEGILAAPETGQVLVARLYPSDGTPLPPGQDSRLIATATVSLQASARSIANLPPVNLPPHDAAYISNMAVDPKFRRMGAARAMLRLCEDAGRACAKQAAWLHVREADEPARMLYASTGYGVIAKDSWMDTMKHKLRPRLLMKKAL